MISEAESALRQVRRLVRVEVLEDRSRAAVFLALVRDFILDLEEMAGHTAESEASNDARRDAGASEKTSAGDSAFREAFASLTKSQRSLLEDYLVLRAILSLGARADNVDQIQSYCAKVLPDVMDKAKRAHLITKLARLRNDKECIKKNDDRLDTSYSITEEGRKYVEKLESAFLSRDVLAAVQAIIGKRA